MFYKFRILSFNLVDVEVTPINYDKLNFEWSSDNGQMYKRIKLSDNIILQGSDYSLIYNLLKQNKCANFYIVITKLCNNTNILTGIFTYLSIVKIDEDTCEIEIKIETDDYYRQLLNSWKKETNILNASTPTKEVYFENSVLTEQQVITHNGATFDTLGLNAIASVSCDDSIANVGGLIPFRNNKVETTLVDVTKTPFGNEFKFHWTVNLVITRIATKKFVPIINGQWNEPDPSAWFYQNGQDIMIGGYINRVYYGYYNNTYTNFLGNSETGTSISGVVYELKTLSEKTFNTNNLLPNCRKLRNVIDYLLMECGMNTPHISHFFYDEINPITNDNDFLLSDLFISQKSDCIFPIDPIGLATKGMISLENLLLSLTNIFDVYFFFDENGILNIEHELFFINGLSYNNININNITIDNKYLQDINKYTISYNELVGRETFKFMEQDDAEFIGLPIIYDTCLAKQDSVKDISINNISTDLHFVYSGNVNDSNKISDDGFLLVITKYDEDNLKYNVRKQLGIFSPTTLIENGDLAWTVLHNKYWRYGRRVITNGKLNNNNTIFDNALKLKVQKEINFPICCYEINPYADFIVNNQRGTADMIKLHLSDNVITIALKYDI